MTDLAPYAAMLAHSVEDLDRWKAGWDRHQGDRRNVGILAHHINRTEDDPDLVTVFLQLTDIDRARAFIAAPARVDEMARFGVRGPPEVLWLEPLRDEVIRDRQLPAIITRGRVADVDAWSAADDAGTDLRQARGIVGHAVHRSLDDEGLVVAYHQAESFHALRAFLADPELAEAMPAGGGISAPEVTFHTGGWASTY